MTSAEPGTLYGVGLGPGDPELITLKAARIIAAAPVIAHFRKRGRPGHARTIAAGLLPPSAIEEAFEYPVTTEVDFRDDGYTAPIRDFYRSSADTLKRHLDSGNDVALLCEGDPFFYGSFLHMYDRIKATYQVVVVVDQGSALRLSCEHVNALAIPPASSVARAHSACVLSSRPPLTRCHRCRACPLEPHSFVAPCALPHSPCSRRPRRNQSTM